MQEMIALVATTVIGGMILIAVGVLAWRTQHHTIDSVQYAAAKSQEMDVARVLEEDINNLGAGLTLSTLDANGAFTDYDPAAGNYELGTWSARGTRTDNLATDDADVVRYEVRPAAATARVRNDAGTAWVTRPTVRVTRIEGGASASYDGVLLLGLRLYKKNGTLITTVGQSREACEVEVVIEAVSPLGGGTASMVGDDGDAPHVDHTRWARRFKPVNLSRAAICRS